MQISITLLDNYDFIRVSGPDTLRFLQGQLSCNTESLSPSRSLTGALCNLKGRVIADFRLLAEDGGCLLQCAENMASPVLATLRKYAVFSKVQLEQLSSSSDARPSVVGIRGEGVDAALASLGISLPDTADAVGVGDYCSAIRLPGPSPRVELWFQSGQAMSEFLSRDEFELDEGREAWMRADIESGIIHVTQELSEEYTPQLLNYDISGLIDFKKGCYTGQEIVARMYYRGKAKKRLYLLSTEASPGPDSRVVIDGEADGPGGEILRVSENESPTLLLAILDADSIEVGEKLVLSDRPGSLLRIGNLPYTGTPKEGAGTN